MLNFFNIYNIISIRKKKENKMEIQKQIYLEDRNKIFRRQKQDTIKNYS